MSEWTWIKAEDLCIEGKGWQHTARTFHRLPARAKGVVREVIWDLSTKPTGLTVRFATDASAIRARWILGLETLSANHTPIYAFSGIDLYAKTEAGEWHWAGLSREIAGRRAECGLTDWGVLDGAMHEFRAYLPLFNSVEDLEFGVPEGAAIEAPARRPERPVAYYGTSVVHGAGVSRPGMTHVAIIGRRLDYPILNLGFSGNAIMEPEIAELLAELDPAAYVLDPVPNMAAETVSDRAVDFVSTLRAARPATPIILVEDRSYPAAWVTPDLEEQNVARRRALKRAYAQLLSPEGGPIYYVDGNGLLGVDNDGTNDGSHTNDLGASRMADSLEPLLRRVLSLGGR
jgi:hypothetical protein